MTYNRNEPRLRISRDLNGKYKVVEEKGREKSIKIHFDNIEDRDRAKRIMQNLKKELGIR